MSLTLEELKEKLMDNYDPDDLLEFLELSSEEILDRFEDKVIKRFEQLEQEFLEEEDEYGY
jgi:hypothetical protein